MFSYVLVFARQLTDRALENGCNLPLCII